MLDSRLLGRSLFATALFGFGVEHVLHAAGHGGPTPGPPWKLGPPLLSWVVAALLLAAASASPRSSGDGSARSR